MSTSSHRIGSLSAQTELDERSRTGSGVENAKLTPNRFPTNSIFSSFTEATDPDRARRARQLHAVGYRDMGFVEASAVADDGSLAADIDKARGGRVKYYLLEQSVDADAEHIATMRKVELAKGEDVRDLPAWDICSESMTEGGRNALINMDRADDRLKEISALARSSQSPPFIAIELMRHVWRESVGSGETWFCSIVDTTFATLVHRFGSIAVRSLGASVQLDDDRVREKVRLVPALIQVDELIENILAGAENASNRAQELRLIKTAVYFRDGLI